MADERLTFDIFADSSRAVAGFSAAGRGAQAAADEVSKLARRLDELKAKSATAKIGVDDAGAKAKLDRLNLQLLRMGRKVTADVTVEGAVKAAVEMSALNAELDKFSRKRQGSLLSRLAGTGPGGGGLLGQLFPSGAGAAGAGGAGLAGIAAAVPAVEALLVEAAGLASGLAAATLGVGAFGALALPTFEKVKTAYTGITAAQKAYTAAQALEKADPTKAHATAAALALTKLKIVEQGMPGPVRMIVTGIQGLTAEFDRMAKVMQPDILKTFNLGLKIATELLPALLPLAQAAAPAIEGLLKQMEGFFRLTTSTTKMEGFGKSLHAVTVTSLTPFGKFMKQIGTLIGPSITAIGEGLGHVAVAFGKLFTVMSKKDVVHSINILFDTIVFSIGAVIWIIKRLMNNWDSLSNAFRTARHDIAHWLDLMRADFDDFRQWIYHDFILRIVRFFTSTLPLAFDIFKESIRLVFDVMKIRALDAVLGITTAFGHLPRAMGQPFRDASTSIRKELGKIQGDAATAAANINADWDRLHGKTITLKFAIGALAGVGGGGGLTLTGHAAGTAGAAPGWAWTGERGPELVHFSGGETVLSNAQSRRVAGYAAGTVGNFTGRFPSARQIAGATAALQNAFNSIHVTVHLPASAIGTGALGGAGGGVLGGDAAANKALAAVMFPQYAAIPAVWNAWNYVAMRESGWNRFARNPSSGAYGIPQALPESKLPFAGQAAGGSHAGAQIAWMWNYMAGRYGGPIGAAAHEAAFNWYDKGGFLPPGFSVAFNGTGRPEAVIPHGRGGGAVKVVLQFPSPHGSLEQALMSWLKKTVVSAGGGSVEVAFGTPR